jgi:hypothetical protein
MIKKVIDNKTLTENARFEGYCIDLLEKIAKLSNFTYGMHIYIHIFLIFSLYLHLFIIKMSLLIIYIEN